MILQIILIFLRPVYSSIAAEVSSVEGASSRITSPGPMSLVATRCLPIPGEVTMRNGRQRGRWRGQGRDGRRGRELFSRRGARRLSGAARHCLFGFGGQRGLVGVTDVAQGVQQGRGAPLAGGNAAPLSSGLDAKKLRNLSSALQSSIETKLPEKPRERWTIG